MLLGGNLWVFGELSGSPFLCPKWLILGSGVTSGVTNWGYIFRKVGLQKWGKTHNDSLGRKTTTFATLCAGNIPFSDLDFWRLHLLYIVYRGFLVYFYAFQGEGEHLRGVFGGVSSSRSRENDTHPGGGYRTGLLQTDDTSNESDGVEI